MSMPPQPGMPPSSSQASGMPPQPGMGPPRPGMGPGMGQGMPPQPGMGQGMPPQLGMGPGMPPQPGMGPGMGPGYMNNGGQQARKGLDPDSMPNPIQVMADDR